MEIKMHIAVVQKIFFAFLGGSFLFIAPFFSRSVSAVDPLAAVYQSRSDLQKVFDAKTGLAISSKAGFLVDLQDWARQYGWREYPVELSVYAPSVLPPEVGATRAPTITAPHALIVDASSNQILFADGAEVVWPIASITKLMTAQVALIKGANLGKSVSVLASDDVGGARLYVDSGTTFTLADLFSAMLIGSANNAANAIARAVSADFVAFMNEKAQAMHLNNTVFVDASGIDPQNVSTAREVALFASSAFEFDVVRRATTTVSKTIYGISSATTHTLKNTNWMLSYPAYDDVYVTSGKTGYLEESGWNLVVRLRPYAEAKDQELLLVLFGAASRADSFADAEALAQWVWDS